MFFKKEYKVIGRREAGTDPFSSETFYVNDYKATMVPVWSHIVMVIIAMVVTIIGIISVIVVVGGNDTAAISNATTVVEETTTTMVEETTTTVAEVTAEELALPVTQYVCDTYTDSKEYTIHHATMQDGSEYDIPWNTMADNHIVFQWNMDDTYLEDFKADIDMFRQYTHMDVQVVGMEYVPTTEDYLIPVVAQDIEGNFTWADMTVGVSVSEVFGIRSVSVTTAMLRLDQLAFDNWEYHNHVVLHELGHMVGLGHTADGEGQQTDSIMSYESDYSHIGYLPGDIEGLKEVLCK